MPNPRLTVRISPDLYRQLPTNEKERSALVIDLLHQHYNPSTPEARLAQLERQVKALQIAFNQHFGQMLH